MKYCSIRKYKNLECEEPPQPNSISSIVNLVKSRDEYYLEGDIFRYDCNVGIVDKSKDYKCLKSGSWDSSIEIPCFTGENFINNLFLLDLLYSL